MEFVVGAPRPIGPPGKRLPNQPQVVEARILNVRPPRRGPRSPGEKRRIGGTGLQDKIPRPGGSWCCWCRKAIMYQQISIQAITGYFSGLCPKKKWDKDRNGGLFHRFYPGYWLHTVHFPVGSRLLLPGLLHFSFQFQIPGIGAVSYFTGHAAPHGLFEHLFKCTRGRIRVCPGLLAGYGPGRRDRSGTDLPVGYPFSKLFRQMPAGR